MQRISVVGTSGSGKTTLARQISQCLAIPHVELDLLHWEPGWVELADDVMQSRLIQAVSSDSWVVDGNLNSTERDIVWVRADTVVFLDYPLWVIMSRVVRRTLWRVVTQQEVCNGNRETWKTTFSSNSIIWWALGTYSKRRKQYRLLLNKSEYSHLTVLHLRSPQATKDWLLSLTRKKAHKR